MPSISLDNNRDCLEQLVEQASILLQETTLAFYDRHRSSRQVSIDLFAQPFPAMRMADLGLVYRAHFLGTFSNVSNTFLWGWENINGFPEEAITVAQNVRRFGEAAHVPEFLTPSIPVPDEQTAARIASSAVRTTGNGNFYRIPSQYGEAYYLIEGFDLGPSQVVAVQRAIGNAISSGSVHNHVDALAAYLDMRPGVSGRGTQQGLVIDCSDGSLEIGLDDQRRVAMMRFIVDERSKDGLRTFDE
ncbi:hypothetical protein O6R08_04290 [Cutibacterium equinum]|uniref:DUF4375 domain-containing protein n=1 Tax=Cutibacterium equinum TaxID=3016342 RepID=A0ABY7R088_9ACTN|nr:DUF6882 domain-containing protein [Cutibacterium equinum]WCC80707.1 hypothetical protein O6R08_04290 [Cutibacterium equinum]